MGVVKYKNILTEEFLIKQYINQEKSMQEIEKEINIPRITIHRYMNKFSIKLRDSSKQNSMNRAKEKDHQNSCLCCICKTKRGEYQLQNHPSWKTGKRIADDGYIQIKVKYHPRYKDRYVYEHIYVMEQYLGRYLNPNEEVHHKGIKFPISSIENRGDNRIENLELTTSIEHARFHGKERYAKGIHPFCKINKDKIRLKI